jgi:hypothetical protein
MCSPGEQSGDGVAAFGADDDGDDGYRAPGDAIDALGMAGAGLDYLNGRAANIDPCDLGVVLTRLGELQAKLTAAHAEVLRRFDAADAHNADGYGTSSAWLMEMTRMARKDARAAVHEMRLLGDHAAVAAALAAGEITRSLGLELIGWTGKLPEELRAETDQILLGAAAAGADLDDLKLLAIAAYEQWRSSRPDGDDDARKFRDRYLQLGITFGGAAFTRGALTPECAAALRAVFESLGKKAGPEDDRTDGQRNHDAVQLACELLLRAGLVPDRAGADTRADVVIPLSELRDMPGAAETEDAWLRARAGQDGYLAGKDAETAACDAVIVPVVTGHPDMAVIDKIIAIIAGAAGGDASGLGARAGGALRWTIARLAIDFVSGPGGIAAALRTGLLPRPYSTRSVPLDIGWSESIPGAIRHAVIHRDKHCAWPGCDRPPAQCDVHHIVHKEDGGRTSVSNCALLCQFHHDVCIHRWGWRLVLHPDATTSAYGPRGQELHSQHPPPTAHAA